MARFEKLYNQAPTAEAQESIMKEGVRAVLKEQQKSEWSSTLAKDYGVSKGKKHSITKVRYIRLYKIAAVAAVMLMLVLIGQNVISSNKNPEQLAMSYLMNETISHPGVLKGLAEPDQEIRQKAIAFFDERDYPAAISQFEVMEQRNAEDQFFLAISYVHANQYDKAINLFQQLNSTTSIYKQEINWYIGLSYILNKNTLEAKEVLSKIKEGEWNYDQTQRLLITL